MMANEQQLAVEYDEEETEARAALAAYQRESGHSDLKLSREWNFPVRAFEQFREGTLSNKVTRGMFVRKIALLQEQETQSHSPGDVVLTSIVSRMDEGFEYCDEKKCGGSGEAPSGSGKSEGCKRRLQRRREKTILITANATRRSVGVFVRELCYLAQGCAGSSISSTLEQLVSELRYHPRLLLIDDAHLLGAENLEVLRYISDQAKVGFFLLGQEILWDLTRPRRQGRAVLYDQLLSRLSIRWSKWPVLRDDVRLISNSMLPGLSEGAIDILFSRAKERGRFRNVTNLLTVCQEIYSRFNAPLDVALIHQAEAFLKG